MTTVKGYVVTFDTPDLNGVIITKESIDLSNFENLKLRGDIVDYEINDTGVLITKAIDLNDYNFEI